MSSRIERLERLYELKTMGAITATEYEDQKSALLSSSSTIFDIYQAPLVGDEHINSIENTNSQTLKIDHADRDSINQTDPQTNVRSFASFWKHMSSSGEKPETTAFSIIIIFVIAIVLIWYSLKYVGLLVGIILLIYATVKRNFDYKKASLLDGVKYENTTETADKRFKVGALSSAAFIFGWASINYLPTILRPWSTQIDQANYRNLCEGKKFKENCVGKFVVWDGSVLSMGNDNIDVVVNGNDFKAYLDGLDFSKAKLTEGQKIKVSGWITDKGWLSIVLSGGQYKALEPIEIAEARENRRKKDEDEQYERRLAAQERALTPEQRRKKQLESSLEIVRIMTGN